MKTAKSPENVEITPSKKKLKQARLPFKILSEVSPKPDTPSTRKRKLSSPELETVTKVGKISKENDVTEPVIISDEEEDIVENKNEKVLPNPYVKLVDAARKKLKKSKKKKTAQKSSKILNGSCEVQNGSDDKPTESMEVDEPITIQNGVPNETEDTKTNKKESQDKSNSNKELDKETDSKSELNSTATVDISSNQSDKGDEESESKTLKGDLETNCNEPDPEESMNESISKCEADSNTKHSENQVTPKRSMRSRNKTDNSSQASPSTKQNNSICSAPSTPKSSQGDVSLNVSTASANLTPKQMQKKLESAKKKEEKEKEKQEREKLRQQAKEEKAKLKQDKEEQRKREREEKEEAKRKEKEEKEEQKRKEKEEREKQKELERKQREEKEEQKRKEKEEKEEQKRKEKEAKEEEKRKKQEALELEKQEQELKKKKAAEAFTNFFVPKQKLEKDQAIVCSVNNSMLSNFTVKSDMRLAPLIRVDLTDNKKLILDNLLEKQSEDVLYLKCLKDGVTKPLSSGKTWPVTDKDDDDIIIIEDAELPPIIGAGEILSSESAPREKLRPKLLSFHENRRPPYWGTWRKKSSSVKPRKPFGQDEKLLDYEVDSDDDWEEEQEGESVGGSVAGSDEEPDGDEYEVDNVVFVPHGYLSDEEATMDEDDVLSLSPETQQARLKHLENEFESEMKKPTEKLKPRMYGLLWETEEGGKPEKCVDALWNYFQKMAMIMNDPTPFLVPSTEPQEGEKKKVKKKKQTSTEKADGEPKQKSPKSDKKKKAKPEEKESKTPKSDTKKNVAEAKKNQPSINMFLMKGKS